MNHVGVIVRDLDEVTQSFVQFLGLELDHNEHYGSELDIAFLPCGETLIELIAPLGDAGASAEHLASHGPSIQHVAFEVENLEASLSELNTLGVGTIGEAPKTGAGNTTIAFLDPGAFGGILVELVEPKPGR